MFRFFSERPYADNWESYAQFYDLRELYLGQGSCADLCRLSFPRVRLVRRNIPNEANEGWLGFAPGVPLSKGLFRAGRPHIKSVRVDELASKYDSPGIGIVQYCPNVKEIRVEDGTDISTLMNFSGQLTSLIVQKPLSQEQMDVIVTNFKHLRALEMVFSRPEHDAFFLFSRSQVGAPWSSSDTVITRIYSSIEGTLPQSEVFEGGTY